MLALSGEKAIWKSKGVLAGVALVALSLLGFDYSADTMKMINDNMDAITGLILAGITIHARITAKTALAVDPMVGTVADYTPSSPTTIVSAATSPAAAAGADMVSAGMELKMYQLPVMPADDNLPKG